MRVRYTPDVFRFQRAGGVSRYFVELTKGLRARDVDARIVAGLHINDLVQSAPGRCRVNVGALGPERARQAVTKVVDLGLTTGIVEGLGRGDIVHPTWYPPVLDRAPRRARLAVTVFDMIHERFPELSIRSGEASSRKRAWVRAADHVLVISEHTGRDLVELFDVDPAKVTVTPLAATVVEPSPASEGEPPPDGPFLLYVGDRRPGYKNVGRLLEALASEVIPADLALVCVGSVPTTDEIDRLRGLGLEGRVSFRPATDGELARLYGAAVALVYPSIYEGFGLPPLEAMAHGCPVVAADAASIPEVVGDAAVLFDPTDAGAMADAVVDVLDPGLRERLVAAGRVRAERFTWDDTVDRTLEVYRALLEASR